MKRHATRGVRVKISVDGATTAGRHGGDSVLGERHRDGSLGQALTSPRLERSAALDQGAAELVEQLLTMSVAILPQMIRAGDFAFRLDGSRIDGSWQLTPAGTSSRYAAIAALGLMRLPDHVQRAVLGGNNCIALIDSLIGRLGENQNLGDVAVICWAAAEAAHADLPRGLDRLAELSRAPGVRYVVDVAWVVTALVAARSLADVEEELSHARDRLIGARGSFLYPHSARHDGPWYRSHVGSFADQVYPLQALARLHASADDPPAAAVAGELARAICAAQGPAGQWWWHYDSRNGSVVEEFPVYSVHQHAMAPMALMDLAEAGGENYLGAVCRGLRWLADPPETAERLILDDPPVIWRKVARSDPRKAVRGLRAASTRLRAGRRLSALDKFFPPGVVDHECRPYELGWLLVAWL
jgi:hypothetical protein